MTPTQTPDSLAEQNSTSIRAPDIRSRVRAHAPFRSIPHVSTLVATITILIVIVVAAVAVFHESGERQVTVGSTPVSPAPSPKQSSTTPPPSIPDGFSDCSAALGVGSYCVETPECWGGLRSYADAPMRADRVRCKSAHYYETFAAGFLATTPLRQSELQAMPEVKELCSARTLAKLVDSAQNPVSRWDIRAIPFQAPKETIFRCLVGPGGERTEPLHFKKPNP